MNRQPNDRELAGGWIACASRPAIAICADREAAGDERLPAPVAVRPLISIVVPCYNEAEVFSVIKERLRALADCLRIEQQCDTEFIFVDDGSRDSTWEQIRTLAEADDRFRGARLSRNFGHQAALTCGYALSAGDAVVSMDADLQDPPEVVPEMVQQWRGGADVVYAVRANRQGETKFKLWTAKIFYRLIRAMGAAHVRAESGDFRLLSRRSLEALLSMGEQHRFLRGMVGWLGFPTAEVHYERQARTAGTTKYSVCKMLRLAADAMVSFSRVPLRLAYYFAFGLSLAFFGCLLYVLVMSFWRDAQVAPGWSSLILAVIAFGAANLLSQALLGEYVGRIYEQSKQRPLYIVQELAAHRTERAGDETNRSRFEFTVKP